MADTFPINKDLGYPLKTFKNSDNTTTLAIRGAGFMAPPNTDAGTVEYPNSTTEIYRFRQGGITGTVLLSLTVIYTDSSKNNIQAWSSA